MSYSIIWQPTALNSYVEEVDFIFLKWNFKEVQKFQDLVSENLERLSRNPEIGEFNEKLKEHSLVLSKQTTLFYSIDSIAKIIELDLFWNNSKNPDDLAKLLY